MDIHVKSNNIRKSYGLGMRPISFIVELGEVGGANDIFSVEQTIQGSGCSDVIFHGEINSNVGALSWLIPKLMSSLVIVTIVSSEGIPKTIANRLVIVVNIPTMKRQLKELKNLRRQDAVFLDVDKVEELDYCRKILLRNEVEAELMFDEVKIETTEVIKEGIFDLVPSRLL